MTATYETKIHHVEGLAGGDAIEVESGGTITVKSGATLAVKAGGILDMQAGSKQAVPIVNIAASRTVTVAESGTVFFLKATDLKMTLPSTAAGLTYTFIVHTVSSSTGAQIDPASADAIHGAGLASTDNKDLINTPGTDAEGDSVTIVGDGVDGWWITAINGTWAEESRACTSGSSRSRLLRIQAVMLRRTRRSIVSAIAIRSTATLSAFSMSKLILRAA